jgi:signal transduction histidine kinase
MSSQLDTPMTVGSFLPLSVRRRTSGGHAADSAVDAPDASRFIWNAFSRAVANLSAPAFAPNSADDVLEGPTQAGRERDGVGAALLGAVAEARRGQRPVIRELAAQANAHDLVVGARRRFLEEIDTTETVVDAREFARLLRAIEAVEMALAEDAAQRFLGRLSGPDATQLVVEIAHDMRSPLGSILFLAEHLRSGRSGALNAIQGRQLGLIYSAALGLNGMTSDVMELARGAERLAAHAPIPFSVAEIVDSTVAIVRPMAEEKGLELAALLPDADFRVGHPAALGRVLLNLVSNALKFTSTGSVTVRVEAVMDTGLRFSVEDTGRGIPPHVLTTLFDSFRRRAEHGYVFSSAGLGLAMCHKLVTAMGGELGVDTELDKGTRFFFQLELPQASAV